MRSLRFGLVDYWSLYEPSGAAYGRASGVTMSDENSVGQALGKVLLARDFNGSNQRLVHASDATVQTGDIDFTWVAWVSFDSLAAGVDFVSKDNDSGTGREYSLRYNNGTNRMRFTVFRSGPTAVNVDADALGAPSTATWYFVQCWHSASADTANIQINNLAVNSQATSGALQSAGSADLHFGSRSANDNHLNGQLCEVGFWKRVLAPQERAWLYNAGIGRGYPFDGRPSPILLPEHGRRHRLVGMIA